MFTLLKMMREKEQLKNPIDLNAVRNIYHENRSLFTWPRDDREATQLYTDFFSDANFIERIKIHKKRIKPNVKARTKADELLTLYWAEINERNKIMNLVAQPNGYKVLLKYHKDLYERSRIKQAIEDKETRKFGKSELEKARIEKEYQLKENII